MISRDKDITLRHQTILDGLLVRILLKSKLSLLMAFA